MIANQKEEYFTDSREVKNPVEPSRIEMLENRMGILEKQLERMSNVNSKKINRVLITGGAGFIGSHLVDRLLTKGCYVKCLDNFSSGDISNIWHHMGDKNFKLINGDIRDAKLLEDITKDVDVIFHLAAQIHIDKSIVDPETTHDVNAGGTLNILQAALRNDVERVIYASSSEVYGSAKYTPMDENHPMDTQSPYSASKLAGDRYCFAFHKTYGLNVTIIRNFNVFGPRQKHTGYGGVIPIFISRVLQNKPPLIYGTGEQIRDYMYIPDAVQAYMLVGESNKVNGEAINFGTGRGVTVNEIADLVIRICGKEGEIKPVHIAPRPGEVMQLIADTKKARNLLWFSPRYMFDQGLEEFINWFREFRNEQWKHE